VSWHVVAPASSANLGPSFDCAAAALDLWNEAWIDDAGELSVANEGEGAGELPDDDSHLSLRAFALFADPSRFRFRFLNRIPLERGLGSSAAAVALGLVAGVAAAGGDVDSGDLLAAGEPFEGHTDNLAAALNGGICVSWREDGRPRARRIAGELPLEPVLAVPATRTNTHASRSTLPDSVSHADATQNAVSATLLGAAVASGDADLLAASFVDRLHERYRSESAPLLEAIRSAPPDGARGVTLSGSGPSVVVWADRNCSARVAEALRRTTPDDTTVLPLAVAREGARVTP